MSIYEMDEKPILKYKYEYFDSEIEGAISGSAWHVFFPPFPELHKKSSRNRKSFCARVGRCGKTICAWHRVAYLLNQHKTVALICPSEPILSLSRTALETLNANLDGVVFVVPQSEEQLRKAIESVDHVVIDEGQEFSPNWYQHLNRKPRKIGVTLFYDFNQLGGNIKAGDLSRYIDRHERWKLAMDRLRLTPLELSINYRNPRTVGKYYFNMLGKHLPDCLASDTFVYDTGRSRSN